MRPFLFAFLLISDDAVQAAVRAPDNKEATAVFPNTQDGIGQFLRWVASETGFSEDSTAHSCLATPAGCDAQLYSSPFFEFAYQATSDTVVWSEAQLQLTLSSVPKANGTALQLLALLASEYTAREP